MTLKEMGEEYLRQADEIEKSIKELKLKMATNRRKGIEEIDDLYTLHNMESILSDLRTNGYTLINCYEDKEYGKRHT